MAPSLSRGTANVPFQGLRPAMAAKPPVEAKCSFLFSISRCNFPARWLATRMDLRELFATNLRRLRHERGLSQDVLAYDAGMSRSYLAQLETGRYYASLKVIGKLAEVMDVDPSEFLRRHGR